MSEIKSSMILRTARRFLWRGEIPILATQHEYICWAVEDAGTILLGSKTDGRVNYIKRRIMDRLNCVSVEDWLAKTVQGFDAWRAAASNQQYFHQLQTHRHRWLDLLIAEYESAGD